MDAEEIRLFDTALKALEAEDRSLRECFPQDDKSNVYGNVAHGLSYWLFETTLVYFVFKAWLTLPGVTVAWEHALRKTERERPDPDIEGRMGAHEKCDLVLLDRDGKARKAFEAKWWTNNSRKTGQALVADANKLRRGFDDGTKKYLLTFWYGPTATVEQDKADADSFCTKRGDLSVLRISEFDTILIGGVKGYFALGMVAVR